MSALNLNKVIMCGRLTADLELKKSQSGLSVVSFTLAINRPKAKDSAEQAADFPSCVAWGKTAEFITKFFKKGDSVCVIGKLQTRSYKNREGRTVYVTEVNIDEAHFVDNKAAADTPPEFNEPPSLDDLDTDADLPWGGKQ